MNSRRPRPAAVRAGLIALAGAGLIGAGAAAFVLFDGAPAPPAPRSAAERPPLKLLSSLPLVFGESFGLDAGGSPALRALEQRYRVEPISVADGDSLRPGGLLLMAHPLAQPAEALVELDRWVREGGRLLLLADPMLEWSSDLPLGDRLRAPPAFADTGLLGHWGLMLQAPDERGPRQQQIGGYEVLTSSPGVLGGACDIAGGGLVARCRIEKGEVTVIADADFLNVEELYGPTAHNLDALVAELQALESPGRADS